MRETSSQQGMDLLLWRQVEPQQAPTNTGRSTTELEIHQTELEKTQYVTLQGLLYTSGLETGQGYGEDR